MLAEQFDGGDLPQQGQQARQVGIVPKTAWQPPNGEQSCGYATRVSLQRLKIGTPSAQDCGSHASKKHGVEKLLGSPA